MNTETILEIHPNNYKNKGFYTIFPKIVFWFLIGLGLISFIAGGFILIAIGVVGLLFFSKQLKKYPVTYVLTEDYLICKYPLLAGIENWKIPWHDIESLYIISTHWAQPKHLGIKFRDFAKFRELIIQNPSTSFVAKFNKVFYRFNTIAKLGRMKTKCDVLLSWYTMDRSADDFALLFYSYMNS